ADALGLGVGDRLQLAQAFDLLHQPLRRLHLEHLADPAARLVEALDPEREAHPPLGAELVDQERMSRLRILEQERRPAGLDDAIGDLGDLEVRIDLGRDANEFALPLQEPDPVAEIGERRQGSPVYGRRASEIASSSSRRRPSSTPSSKSGTRSPSVSSAGGRVACQSVSPSSSSSRSAAPQSAPARRTCPRRFATIASWLRQIRTATESPMSRARVRP